MATKKQVIAKAKAIGVKRGSKMTKAISEYGEQKLVEWYKESQRETEPGHEKEVYLGIGQGSVVNSLESNGLIAYTRNNWYKITPKGVTLAKKLMSQRDYKPETFRDTEP